VTLADVTLGVTLAGLWRIGHPLCEIGH